MFFWNSLAFLMIHRMLAIWSLVSLPLLNPAEHLEVHSSHNVKALLEEFWALLCWRVRWVQLCSSLNILWHCLSLGLEWKLTFSSPLATAEFPSFPLNIEWSTLTASSFRIWNNWTGIPSPPLALFTVILPKAHFSHSRISESRWVTSPFWLSELWRSF